MDFARCSWLVPGHLGCSVCVFLLSDVVFDLDVGVYAGCLQVIVSAN